MVFAISQIKDLEYSQRAERDKHNGVCYETPDGKIFLVMHKNTLELRTDEKLKNVLCERYESVMESRHFGKGGIEVVMSAQLTDEELVDLVRLSYQLSQ